MSPFLRRAVRGTSAALAAALAVTLLPGAGVLAGPGKAPVAPEIQNLRLDELGALPSPIDLPAPRASKRVVAQPTAGGAADRTQPFRMVGLTWSGDTPDELTTWVRTKSASGGWSSWFELGVQDEHAPDPGSMEAAGVRPGTEPIFVPRSNGVQVAVASADGSRPTDLRVHLIDPGTAAADASVGNVAPGAASAQVSQPAIYSRADWGADESLRTCCTEYGEVLGAVVHHTVAANDYAAADVPALIRGIYAFHVTSRGYRDIGYNFLVDRFGRLWEGRFGGIDKAVIGAQALGFNDDTTGAAVIGTYTDVEPAPASLDALARLFSWKLDLHGVDPMTTVDMDGTMVPAISGHRDTYATECPGARLYAKLGTIRQATDTLIDSVASTGGSPFGNLDSVAAGAQSVTASGWVIDPDTTGPVPVEVRVDGVLKTTQTAADPRPDVGNVYPAYGPNHGFRIQVPATPGTRTLCLTAVNTGAGTNSNLGCRTVNVGDVFERPTDGVLRTQGRGFGHGIGMSQWGAQQAAASGTTWERILAFYYPGTTRSATDTGLIRVLLESDTGSDLIARSENGMRIAWTDQSGAPRDESAPTSVGGCTPSWWRAMAVGNDLAIEYLCNDSWFTWQATSAVDGAKTISFRTSDGTIDNPIRNSTGFTRKAYRGTLEGRLSNGSIAVVNVLPLESYLYSVVPNEVPASWPAEALKAQATAARTYAMRERYDRGSQSFHVYDSTRSQVYPGLALYDTTWNTVRNYEDSRTTAAVNASGGVFLSAAGIPAFTQFSSSNGGWTAAGSAPYLPRQEDAWDWAATGNPYREWTSTTTAASLESRYPSIGTLQRVRVLERDGGGAWGGRITRVALEGSAGTATVVGDSAIRTAFGTRSSYFTFQ